MRDIPTKHTGDQFLADECTDMFTEEENVIKDTGITLSGGDLFQISKAVSNYVASGDYYNESGVVNAYVVAPLSTKKSPTNYVEGMRVRFYPGNDNTGPSTINVNSLGLKTITKFDGNALGGGEIVVNAEITLAYDGTKFRITSGSHTDAAISTSPKFRGCILKNSVGHPLKGLDFGNGFFRADNADLIFSRPFVVTKMIDDLWVAGTNEGGRAGGALAEGWWHNFYIAKPDGTTDAGWDSSINATNLLAAATGYKYYARRSSTYIAPSINISWQFNLGNKFWNAEDGIVPIIVTDSFAPATIQVPIDVTTLAFLNVEATWGISPGKVECKVHQDILLDSWSRGIVSNYSQTSYNYFEIITNTNAQIEHRYVGSNPTSYQLRTVGYEEFYD